MTIATNTGQERSATLVFETEHGQMQRITLRQEGHGNTIRFFNDDFGTGASAPARRTVRRLEPQRNRQPALSVLGQRCQRRLRTGLLGYRRGLRAATALFSPPIRPTSSWAASALKGDINFNLSFGCMTSQAAFAPAQFQVFFSKDRVNWTPIAYDRSSGAGWEAVNIPFYLPEGVDQLYIRFLGRKAGAYRLDDVTLAEGDGRGETITFVEDIVEYEEIPVFNEAFDWCVGPNSTLPGNDGSNMTTVSNRNGWEGNLVYMHSGFPKIGTSSGLGYSPVRDGGRGRKTRRRNRDFQRGDHGQRPERHAVDRTQQRLGRRQRIEDLHHRKRQLLGNPQLRRQRCDQGDPDPFQRHPGQRQPFLHRQCKSVVHGG